MCRVVDIVTDQVEPDDFLFGTCQECGAPLEENGECPECIERTLVRDWCEPNPALTLDVTLFQRSESCP